MTHPCFFSNAGSYGHNDRTHKTKNLTFLRRPEVPGFMPSMGSVAFSTTLPPLPPPRMAAAAASVESSSLVMLRNTWFGSRSGAEGHNNHKNSFETKQVQERRQEHHRCDRNKKKTRRPCTQW